MPRDSVGNLGLTNKKIGMLIFLTSEIMFFTGLLGAYMVLRHTAKTWPVVSDVLNFRFGILNTVLLSFSSVVYILNLKKKLGDRNKSSRIGWGFVLILGILFLGVQLLDCRELWVVKNIRLSTSMFGAWFYVLTAFHGLHLLAGILCLAWFIFRSKSADAYETLGLYWCFVSAVWLVLFLTLYIIA